MAGNCAKEQRSLGALIKQHLGKSCVKKAGEILMNILVTDRGIKPAFLFDFCSCDQKTIRELLADLKLCGLIGAGLSVLEVAGEIFIMNTPRDVGVDFVQLKVSFVDVSIKRDSAKLLEAEEVSSCLQTTLDDYTGIINDSRLLDRVSVDLTVGANGTSMFGLLLGYPVVYWYDAVNCTDNCLAMTQLVVFNVYMCFKRRKVPNVCASIAHRMTAMCQNGCVIRELGEQLVYSFSVPVMVIGDCRNVIDDWFAGLTARCEENDAMVRLEEKVVTLPAVSM